MHKAVAFLAPKKTRKFEDFYVEWIDALDVTLLPVLNGSGAGITEAFLASHVDRIHQHFQNYYTALDAAVISCPHRHLPLLLHPPWFSPLQVPFLFLGDLHPFLLTTLLRSFVLDRDDEDGETDLDEDGGQSDMKSPPSEYYHEEGPDDDDDAREIHDVHRRMATAWKRPSGVLISRIGEMERWVRRMVPDLTSRVRVSQHRFAEKLGKRLDMYEEDGNGLGVREAAEEEMKEMVTAFLEGNRLRRSVMEEIMRATDAYQAASYFQALGQFIVGLRDKKVVEKSEQYMLVLP
ncbi:hypothetical protein MLD38_023540 [Melastoma candidum]|uniref:Uncharacterized protein n=1 Tax=Melastoma candidum TaxID=119954 RepID=A0ACB9NR98_9MYRT|nr:hypothetical protein MLD38_023540 [Melastoma candidum]